MSSAVLGSPYGATSRNPPIREEAKMKFLVIALLSSPVLLAYELKPEAMQNAVMQALHYLLSIIVT